MTKTLKKIKFIAAFVLVISILFCSVTKVSAAPDTIQLGDAPVTEKYIAGVSFHYKKTVEGIYLYCLDIHKNTARNTTARLVKNSPTINGGLIYILKNGYPYKSITGDTSKDYYITQTALWWYLDNTTGSRNLGDKFKGDGSDPHDLRKYVKQLVTEAEKHKSDKIGYEETKLELTNTTDMTLENNYYISKPIKAKKLKNAKSYKVTLKNAPEGTKIIKPNGKEVTYKETFKITVKDAFRINVPTTKMNKADFSIKVVAKTDGITQYMAYEYQPDDNSMQNVAVLETTKKGATSKLTLDIESSKVTITKIDSNTKKPIAGANLVLKDANGKIITNWTSTTNAHIIRNLTAGTYTIEETTAPTGYLLNENKTTFTISEVNKNVAINIENAPKKVVVNITKLDQETNTPLAGAILVVKNSQGIEVARFTTTEESYVLTDLEDGTYTVEEESAPEGYIKSDEKATFTIDNEHLSHQITFINAKEVFVPDTASVSSIIILILGIGLTGLGIGYIYKNGKKA